MFDKLITEEGDIVSNMLEDGREQWGITPVYRVADTCHRKETLEDGRCTIDGRNDIIKDVETFELREAWIGLVFVSVKTRMVAVVRFANDDNNILGTSRPITSSRDILIGPFASIECRSFIKELNTRLKDIENK